VRWERDASAALGAAVAQIRLLACATPTNLAEELADLERDFRAGRERQARFRYAPRDLDSLATKLEAVGERLTKYGPLATLYVARARELGLEARICGAVGRKELGVLATRRYATRRSDREQADAVATAWLNEPPAAPDDAMIVSDDESDPRSLLCRMRSELGQRRVAMRVVVSKRLSALAATGAHAIYVAAERRMSTEQIERTVIHEIEGHALARDRARRERLGLFALGSAGGSDHQEGRALLIEQRYGHLTGERRRELALRHRATSLVSASADEVETVRALRELGTSLQQALRIAMRVHRGGGLARERVYLPSLIRLQKTYAHDPTLEAVMERGNVSVDAAKLLRSLGSPARLAAGSV